MKRPAPYTHRDVALRHVAAFGLMFALIAANACSKDSERDSANPAAEAPKATAAHPVRRDPLKREWQGARLGTTEPELTAAMRGAGLDGSCEDYGHKYLTRVDPARHETVREERDGAFTVKECSFRHKEGASSGVARSDATLVDGRLYRLMLQLAPGETFDGVVNSLSDTLGAQPWQGTMTTVMVNSLSGQRQEDTSEAAMWSDEDTAIIAESWSTGTVAVSYTDLAVPRALDAANDRADRAEQQAKDKARSNVDF